MPNGNVPNGLPMMPTHSDEMQGPPPPPMTHPSAAGPYAPHHSAPPPSMAPAPSHYSHEQHYYMSMNSQIAAQKARRPIRAAQVGGL